MADPRTQQARERAEAVVSTEPPYPLPLVLRGDLADDVLYLADRVAALETALRKIQDVYGTDDCTCIICQTCRAALAAAQEPPLTVEPIDMGGLEDKERVAQIIDARAAAQEPPDDRKILSFDHPAQWREVTPGESPELTVTACPDEIVVVGDTASYALDGVCMNCGKAEREDPTAFDGGTPGPWCIRCADDPEAERLR